MIPLPHSVSTVAMRVLQTIDCTIYVACPLQDQAYERDCHRLVDCTMQFRCIPMQPHLPIIVCVLYTLRHALRQQLSLKYTSQCVLARPYRDLTPGEFVAKRHVHHPNAYVRIETRGSGQCGQQHQDVRSRGSKGLRRRLMGDAGQMHVFTSVHISVRLRACVRSRCGRVYVQCK